MRMTSRREVQPKVCVCQLAYMIHIYVCLPSWLKITSNDVIQDGVSPYVTGTGV
jgi:hypothetical protein